MIKYGIISDVHNDPRIVASAISVLKNQGAEKLILNGDVGNCQQFVGSVLQIAGESELETYVQPGSHEKLEDFEPVIDFFKNKYSNLVNCVENNKISCKGHDLIFMPGSDFSCGGEYVLSMQNGRESGFYQTDNGNIRLTNMSDLSKLVTNPDKTIVVCHVPRKFDDSDICVDVAHFHQQRVYHRDFKENPNRYTYTELLVQPGTIPKQQIENQGIRTFRLEDSEDYILNTTLKLMKKEDMEKIVVSVERNLNRGNKDLKKVYEELGIKKAVSGHFHESGHRACDWDGNSVEEGKKVDELFWNSGYCDAGQVGILDVQGSEVSYQNIRLQDYIK